MVFAEFCKAVGVRGLEVFLLIGAHPVLCLPGRAEEAGQRQVIQRGEILDLGVADVQHFQGDTVGKRRQIVDITAVGKLQELQLLAYPEGLQGFDGGTGDDQVAQLRHTGNKAGVGEPFVVADVHVHDILAVHQILAVAVKQTVAYPDGSGICKAGAGHVFAEPHTPDDLGSAPVVVPELGQKLVGEIAVVQHDPGAQGHDVQGLPELSFVFVPQLLVLEGQILRIVGRDIHTKQLKGVVDGGLGNGIHQRFHIGLGEGRLGSIH